jgi:hypothetical protein
MKAIKANRRPALVGVISFAVFGLAGCNETNVGRLPTDAAASLTAFVSNAQDARRASDALGWASTVAATKLAVNAGGIDTFKGAVCAPPFFGSAMAVKAFQSFNDDVAELAKAPADSLGELVRALNDHNQQLKDIGANAKPPAKYSDLQDKLLAKCAPLIDRDLALEGSVAPQASPTLAINAILALAKLVTSVTALTESRARAEVVRAYVLAHEAEVKQALQALAGKDGLQAAIQTTRTYYLRRAYAAYSDLKDLRESPARLGTPALDVADQYAQFVAKYLKLQNVDATKLIDDKDSGLRPAYDKFIQQIRQPNADPTAALDSFLGFLKAVSDINSNRQDYVKALKDMEGDGP